MRKIESIWKQQITDEITGEKNKNIGIGEIKAFIIKLNLENKYVIKVTTIVEINLVEKEDHWRTQEINRKSK